MEQKASSHLYRYLCLPRWVLREGGAWDGFGESSTNSGHTHLAGWVEPAPCDCVSGRCEPLLASASPCSVLLPACERRGASSASSTETTEQALTAQPTSGFVPLPGKVLPKAGAGWEPAASCRKCPLGKGTAARAAGWLEQHVSLTGACVSSSQQQLSKLGIYWESLQCFAVPQEASTSSCFCGCCARNAKSHL